MCPPPSEARIDATAGLQMSQPLPWPCLATSSLNARMPVERTISNSSALLCSKCSQSALDCSTPQLVSSCLSEGTQEPHPVPALVHALSAGTSAQPCSVTAAVIAPLVTAWQAQICASSGNAPTPKPPPPPAGAISEAGSAASSLPTSGRSEVYAEAS